MNHKAKATTAFIFLVSAAAARPSMAKTNAMSAMINETIQLEGQIKEAHQAILHCKKKHGKAMKLLKAYESALKKLLHADQASRAMAIQLDDYKSQWPHPHGRNLASVTATPTHCEKKEFLENVLADAGVADRGGIFYSRQPLASSNATCWTNGRRKVTPSLTVCEFPLSVNVLSRGGLDGSMVIREREYMFDPAGCHVMSVHRKDTTASETRETFLTYKDCLTTWDKWTDAKVVSRRDVAAARAAKDTATQLEDVIGFCFREHLLPPWEDTHGRQMPNYLPPADHK